MLTWLPLKLREKLFSQGASLCERRKERLDAGALIVNKAPLPRVCVECLFLLQGTGLAPCGAVQRAKRVSRRDRDIHCIGAWWSSLQSSWRWVESSKKRSPNRPNRITAAAVPDPGGRMHRSSGDPSPVGARRGAGDWSLLRR